MPRLESGLTSRHVIFDFGKGRRTTKRECLESEYASILYKCFFHLFFDLVIFLSVYLDFHLSINFDPSKSCLHPIEMPLKERNTRSNASLCC